MPSAGESSRSFTNQNEALNAPFWWSQVENSPMGCQMRECQRLPVCTMEVKFKNLPKQFQGLANHLQKILCEATLLSIRIFKLERFLCSSEAQAWR